MQARAQAFSPSHLITLAEIASAIAIARGTAGLEELHWLAQQAANGLLTAHLYPPHQPWQNGNITNSDGKQARNSAGTGRYGKPASNPAGIWRVLGTKAMLTYRGDKDAFNYPPAASTWHMLAADVYALAQQPIWSAVASAALRDIACRYSPELMGETATPAPPPEPALVDALPAQAQAQAQAAAPEPVAGSASSVPSNGLATAQIAVIFDGLPYTAENWTRRASDIKWLEPARERLGAAGGATSLWCPATLARLIHGRGRGAAKQKTLEALNKRFRSNPVLEPWRDAWNQHYEMFNDAD